MIKKNKGFTLIEVVIVLAIAALIILVVLQAVTAANKSNRDTARKQEAGRVVSLLEQFASNNGGTYPTAANINTASGILNYDNTLITKYTFTAGGAYNSGAQAYQTANAASCNGTAANTYKVIYTLDTTTNRDYDLGVCLENGGLVMEHPSL